jgi:excisionase family DNA binding protein
MAKMFYTLDEAAEKLGVSPDQVKEMASSGRLQQFRDRDKLMFKRDQIDNLNLAGASGSQAIPLSDSKAGGTFGGNISLADDSSETQLDASQAGETDPKQASGVSVFDAGEVEPADPMAQTQVTGQSTSVDDEELALETVGSGSGLLDLTRESDDTSLGAELLDEIYPGSSGSQGGDFRMESSVGSSGVFDGAVSMETGMSGPSGLQNLGASSTGVAGPVATASPVVTSGAVLSSYQAEDYDPVGSGMSAGLLFGALAALSIGLIVVVAHVLGHKSALLPMLIEGKSSKVLFLALGLGLVSVVFAVVGAFFGKAARG